MLGIVALVFSPISHIRVRIEERLKLDERVRHEEKRALLKLADKPGKPKEGETKGFGKHDPTVSYLSTYMPKANQVCCWKCPIYILLIPDIYRVVIQFGDLLVQKGVGQKGILLSFVNRTAILCRHGCRQI